MTPDLIGNGYVYYHKKFRFLDLKMNELWPFKLKLLTSEVQVKMEAEVKIYYHKKFQGPSSTNDRVMDV